MSLPRRIEPEWLDELPAHDPRAIRSRRDLARINTFMLEARIMARLLARNSTTLPRKIVELGAGDGTFMLKLAQRMMPRWPGVRVTLVDRNAVVSEATRAGFRALGWQVETAAADVFDFLGTCGPGEADIMTANLFLHHFSSDALARLFAPAARIAPLFVACEPERSGFALLASRLLFAIGCSSVSRHDAVASVRAGFRAKELVALWPREGWAAEERYEFPFTHSFVARRLSNGGTDV